MRHLLLLVVVLLLPQLVWAQFSKEFEAGSYALAADNGKRQYGRLKLKNERRLLVETAEGRRLKFSPKQVSNFHIDGRIYVVAKDFHLSVNSHSIDVKAAFVQQLDSGTVILMRYDHYINRGIDWLYLYRYHTDAYLFQIPPNFNNAVINDYFDKSIFRQQTRPCLATRPDLILLLDEGRITYASLPAAIHALNNNLPFLTSVAPKRKE